MSEYFTGITFPQQKVTPSYDATIHRAVLDDGVLDGCALSYSGYTLTMDAGHLIVCGRQFLHAAVQNWAVSGATSGYARLILAIDTTRASTKAAFDQVVSSIEYAASIGGFADLVQQDINQSGTIYQMVACVVSLGSGGITGIVSKLPGLDVIGPASKKYVAEAVAGANDYSDARSRDAAPVNLLDNSNLSNAINQRGEDEYYGTSGYTIDRWRAVSSLRVTVESDCVTVKHEGNVNSAFTQYLGTGAKLVQGEAYTAAIKLKGSPAIVGSVVRSAADYDTAITLSSGTTVRLAGSADRLLLMVVPGDVLNIEWIALYRGEYTAKTLPAYRYKGYAAELHACERYFRVLRNASGYVSASNGYIFAPYNMRTTPTATVKAIGSIRTQGKSVTPKSVSEVVKYVGEGIRLTMPGEYGSANYAAALYDAKIWLSADLGEG